MSARVPYGYRIENGLAVIDEARQERLLRLFECYLSGCSLKQSAALARIDRTWKCCRAMLVNPVYTGTDYYPPLIPESLHRRAVQTVYARGAHLTGKKGGPVREPIPAATRFTFDTPPHGGADAAERAEALYGAIGIRG